MDAQASWSGCYINVQHCGGGGGGGGGGSAYGSSATERPLGTIPEEKGISSRSQVSVSSRYELSC